MEVDENNNNEQSFVSKGRPDIHQWRTAKPKTPIYAMGWNPRPSRDLGLAIGSYLESYSNYIEIIRLDEEIGVYQSRTFPHGYPATNIMWNPDFQGPELLATTSDCLRIYQVQDSIWEYGNDTEAPVILRGAMGRQPNQPAAPQTSFDWNAWDPSLIGTSDFEGKCYIWDIETRQIHSRLVAHDREAYDIAFASRDIFASVGGDGSVRMFDLRSLQHSMVLYESPNLDPVIKLEWNKQDPNWLATFNVDSNKVILLDVRVMSSPAAELDCSGNVTGMAWAPHSSCHICSISDDARALIWDVSSVPSPITGAIREYKAKDELAQVKWNPAHTGWISLASKDMLEVLWI